MPHPDLLVVLDSQNRVLKLVSLGFDPLDRVDDHLFRLLGGDLGEWPKQLHAATFSVSEESFPIIFVPTLGRMSKGRIQGCIMNRRNMLTMHTVAEGPSSWT